MRINSDIEPLVFRDLAQRGKAVNRRAMTYYSLLRLSLQNSILPLARVCGPRRVCCQCKSMTSKYSVFASLRSSSNFLLRIHALVGGYLGHEAIAIAWDSLQGQPSIRCISPYDSAVFEEANAAVVGVAHQPGKPVLSQVALNLAAEAACAKAKPRHLSRQIFLALPNLSRSGAAALSGCN